MADRSLVRLAAGVTALVSMVSLAGPASAGTPYIGVVQGSEVKIRTGGSQNHHAFAAVRMGQRVVVDRETAGWCRILMPRWIPVYVHKDYVTLSGTHGLVKAGELNIRVVPQRAHEVVGNLVAGSEVEVLGKDGDWLKIVPPPTAYAYISQRYVVKEREITLEEAARQVALLSSQAEPALAASKRLEAEPGARLVTASAFTTPALQRAEKMLLQIVSREPGQRDYAPVKAIYQELVQSSEDRTEIAAAQVGLQKVEKLEESKALFEAAQQSIADVERKNRDLDEQVRQARLSGRSLRRADSDTYLARGWVTGLGRFNGHPGTHRLLKGSQVLYYLQSEEGKAIQLDSYLNKRVGVKGTIRELDPKFGANLIVVSEMTVLSDL